MHRGHVISIAAQRAQRLNQSHPDIPHQSPNKEVPSACVAGFNELLSCLTYISSLAACFHRTFNLVLSFVNQPLLSVLAYSHLRQDASPFSESQNFMYHRRGALAKDEFVLVFVLPIKHVVILEYASRLAASVLLLNVLTYGKHASTWDSCTTTFWDFRRVIVDCFTTLLSNVSGSFLISRG